MKIYLIWFLKGTFLVHHHDYDGLFRRTDERVERGAAFFACFLFFFKSALFSVLFTPLLDIQTVCWHEREQNKTHKKIMNWLSAKKRASECIKASSIQLTTRNYFWHTKKIYLCLHCFAKIWIAGGKKLNEPSTRSSAVLCSRLCNYHAKHEYLH